jgi:glycosyltransferase involved in cell wall biosynthesis
MARDDRSTEFCDLSVIVAVRDVEETIGRDVRSLAALLRDRGMRFEILAASDGSRDTSLTLLRLLGEEMPELAVLGFVRGGRAFRRAIAQATGQVVLLWEADGRTPFPSALFDWALAQLTRRTAVVVRGRFVLARRLSALPILLELAGRWDDYDARFERLAARNRMDMEIAGPRRRHRGRRLIAPVLRILSIQSIQSIQSM